MPVLVGNNIPEMSLNVSLDLVNSVGEKNRRSRKGFAAAKFKNDISKFSSASCLLLGFLHIVLVSGHETCEIVPKNPYKRVLF